jgi:hypothetical protein
LRLQHDAAEGEVLGPEEVRARIKEGLVPARGSGADSWAAKHGTVVQSFNSRGRDQSVYMSTDLNVAKGFARIVAEGHPGSKARQGIGVAPLDRRG